MSLLNAPRIGEYPTLSCRRPAWLIGRMGEGGPGLCECRDLAAVLQTVPELEPGEFWIAWDSVMWGTARVEGPGAWEVEGMKGVTYGPGYIIV
jgi:hypothetical protein